MEQNKLLEKNYSFKEAIIEYSIAAAIVLVFVILLIATGFYWGYSLMLIPAGFFLIDGIITHRRVLRYRKQKENRKNNNNPL